MIGIVIVTHSRLGEALIEAAEFILHTRPKGVTAISIDLNESAKLLRQKIMDGIKSVDQQKGVLILTDMFGGTPSNLAYSFLNEGNVEVIAGVNLPVLIKAVSAREAIHLSELATDLEHYGKRSISLASGILKGNKSDQKAKPEGGKK